MSVEEGEAKLYAMGHVERYWTHSLTIDAKQVNSPSCIPQQTPEWIGQYEKQTSDNLVSYYGAKDHTGNYCSNIKLAYLPSKSKVKSEKESLPYNSPVWIIRSEDARILDGHNGYGGSQLIIPFVQQLYHQLTLENNAHDVSNKAR